MGKISIITTTYKHKDFIKYTIESIISQTFTDRELLIGDDSPDNETWNIIQEYVKKYPDKIKARHHKPNKGIIENMNFLISKVSIETEYISFLEGDDMYSPNNLSEKINIFKKHTNTVLIYTDYKLVDQANKQKTIKRKRKMMKPGINKLSLFQLLKMGNPIQSFGAVCIKKDILSKNIPLKNLDKENKMFGPSDYLLRTKVIPNNSIYYLNKDIFIYRVHENNFVKNISLMNQQLILIYKDIIKKNRNKVINKICKFYIEYNNMISSFFEKKTLDTIKYGFRSLRYNRTILLNYRLGIMFVSLMPETIKNFLIYKFKS